VATVVALVPDLLFGSSVQAMVQAAGHRCELRSTLSEADLAVADAVIVDLTADVDARLRAAAPAIARGLPTLAFYSHVEAGTRAAALRAGVGVVVPRSRMAREGAALVTALLDARGASASGPSD
jgi:hypothetical protein